MTAGTHSGVAGVRLADGRQIFVESAPQNLEQGTRVAVHSADHEIEGIVSIAPRLIVWRDPEMILGRFLRIVPSAAPDPLEAAEPPLALFLADEGSPEAARLNEMLHLARAETVRLDD
jgi:hypothetical protein